MAFVDSFSRLGAVYLLKSKDEVSTKLETVLAELGKPRKNLSDNAKEFKIFWFITLPQLKPMMYFGVILSLIGGLQLLEEPFIITGGRGGPEYSGMTTAMYMYRTAFEFNDYGLASAISWLLFLVIAVLTWLTNRAFKPKGGLA